MAHYVDNKKLYESFKTWKEKYTVNPNTPIPYFIAESIILIANNLAKKYNFNQYTS